MSKQVGFINRENELASIDKLVNKGDTLHFICINADGGIGKTRLLQRICEIYQGKKIIYQSKPCEVVVTDIIDFDDRTFHAPNNVGRKIAEMLDKKHFEDYILMLSDFFKMERAGVSSESLSKKILENNEKFIDSFNSFSANKRIILCFDTTEKLQRTDFWNYLISMGAMLNNCIILIAGRDSRTNAEYLQKRFGDNTVQIIDLPPLAGKSAKAYLQEKQKIMNIHIESEFAEKLVLLADGRPILIDLAVEWWIRGIPIKLFAFSNIRKKDFERELVIHIAQTRKHIDRLIILMSHVYPLYIDMINTFLNFGDVKKAVELLNEAKTYVFIKTLPNGRITLHDEMRRMVNDYIWTEIDPDKERRIQYSRLALDYINKQILQKNIEHNDEAKPEAERLFIEEELLLLKADHLKHTLFINIEDGVKEFAEIFDEATRISQFLLREILITEMQQYEEKLSSEQLYILNSKRIKSYMDRGYYKESKEMVNNILENHNLSVQDIVDMLIQLGNIEIRLGDYKSGHHNFEKAVTICKENNFENQDNLKSYLMKARNVLGWSYRLMGQYENAIVEYEKARDMSIYLNNRYEKARILNNLSFAHNRNGNHIGAFNLAKEAERLWTYLNNDEGKGMLYHIYSEIYIAQFDFDKAIFWCEEALKIFKKMEYVDWINRMYSILGTCYWERANFNLIENRLDTLNDDLYKSENELKKAFNSEGWNKIIAMHYLGHVYLLRYEAYSKEEDINNAYKYFADSYEKSKKASLNVIQLNSLGDLVQIAEKRKEYNKLEHLEKEYETYKEIWGDYPKYFNGLFLKYLGDIYTAITPVNRDKIINSYFDGICLIALHGFKRGFYLSSRLREIEERLSGTYELKSVKFELGKKLNKLWVEDKRLDYLHPETREYFIRWQQGESLND